MIFYYIIDENGNKINPGTLVPELNIIVPTQNDQTNFTLSDIINPESKPLLEVNGQAQELGRDYSVLGNLLQWISNDFKLSTTDRLNFYYSR